MSHTMIQNGLSSNRLRYCSSETNSISSAFFCFVISRLCSPCSFDVAILNNTDHVVGKCLPVTGSVVLVTYFICYFKIIAEKPAQVADVHRVIRGMIFIKGIPDMEAAFRNRTWWRKCHCIPRKHAQAMADLLFNRHVNRDGFINSYARYLQCFCCTNILAVHFFYLFCNFLLFPLHHVQPRLSLPQSHCGMMYPWSLIYYILRLPLPEPVFKIERCFLVGWNITSDLFINPGPVIRMNEIKPLLVCFHLFCTLVPEYPFYAAVVPVYFTFDNIPVPNKVVGGFTTKVEPFVAQPHCLFGIFLSVIFLKKTERPSSEGYTCTSIRALLYWMNSSNLDEVLSCLAFLHSEYSLRLPRLEKNPRNCGLLLFPT